MAKTGKSCWKLLMSLTHWPHLHAQIYTVWIRYLKQIGKPLFRMNSLWVKYPSPCKVAHCVSNINIFRSVQLQLVWHTGCGVHSQWHCSRLASLVRRPVQDNELHVRTVDIHSPGMSHFYTKFWIIHDHPSLRESFCFGVNVISISSSGFSKWGLGVEGVSR